MLLCGSIAEMNTDLSLSVIRAGITEQIQPDPKSQEP